MTRLSSEHVFSGVAPSPCLDPTDGVSPYSVTGQVSAYRPTRTLEGTANISFAGSCCGRGGHYHIVDSPVIMERWTPSLQPQPAHPPSFSCRSPNPFADTPDIWYGVAVARWEGGGRNRERERGAYCTFQPIRASFEPLARSRSRHSLPSPSSAPPPDCLTGSACKSM